MSDYTWKQAAKDAPAYLKQGCINVFNYWRNAPPREWVAETIWLAIVVSIFYYGINGVMAGMEWASNAGVDPNGPVGILLTFAPLILVFIIFFANWIYSGVVRFIFSKMSPLREQ